MGNQYHLINIIPNLQTGHVKSLVFSNEDGKASRRLADGKVYSDRASPRDIVLKGLRTDPRAFKRMLFDSDENTGLDFITDDDDDDDTFFNIPPRGKRARNGSYVPPKFDLSDLGDDDSPFEGPNLKRSGNGDLEITIKFKR